jgi:hypothetical protein
MSEMMMLSEMLWKTLDKTIRFSNPVNLLKVSVAGWARKMRFGFSHRADLGERPPQSMILRICGTEEYFAQLLSTKLPEIEGLTLNHLLDLWQVIYSAIEALAVTTPDDTGPKNISELDRFAPLVPKSALIDLLKQVSGLSRPVCERVLNFWTFSKETADDIWARPIIEYDQNHVIPLIPCILHGSPLRLIERWMKFGGVDLAKRGTEFEAECRSTFKESIQSNNLLKNSELLNHPYRFTKSDEDPGDVDLVFWINRTVFIAEIKCNLFPTKASERSRYHEDLVKGARQIIRKANCIRRNPTRFIKSISGLDSTGEIRVVPFVLTNLTFEVGECIDDVPITDRYILNKFLAEGYFDKSRIVSKENGITGGYRMFFYDDENEAEARLEDYLRSPPQLLDFKDAIAETITKMPRLNENDRDWEHCASVVSIDGEKHRHRISEKSKTDEINYRSEPLP